MLIVHATRKLAQRLGRFMSAPTALSAAPALGPWYATAIFWKPQVVLFVSESTLLPVFVPLAPAATVLRRFPAELEVVLRRHGAPEAFITGELSTLGDGHGFLLLAGSHESASEVAHLDLVETDGL